MLQSEHPLLGDYLDEWLERRRTQLRPTTLRGYRSAVDCYVKPTLGSVPLSCVDRRTLEQLYARLLASGGLHGKPLSPNAVRLAHAIVRRGLADAVLDGLLDTNPAARAREMLGLRWRDVDLEEGEVRIRRSLSVVDGDARLLGTKTSRAVCADQARQRTPGSHHHRDDHGHLRPPAAGD